MTELELVAKNWVTSIEDTYDIYGVTIEYPQHGYRLVTDVVEMAFLAGARKQRERDIEIAYREHEQDYNPTEWIIKAIRDQDKEDSE